MKNSKGIAPIIILLIVAVFATAGGGGYYLQKKGIVDVPLLRKVIKPEVKKYDLTHDAVINPTVESFVVADGNFKIIAHYVTRVEVWAVPTSTGITEKDWVKLGDATNTKSKLQTEDLVAQGSNQQWVLPITTCPSATQIFVRAYDQSGTELSKDKYRNQYLPYQGATDIADHVCKHLEKPKQEKQKPAASEISGPKVVTVEELGTNPQKHNGQTVKITGVMISGFEVGPALSDATVDRNGTKSLKEPSIYLNSPTIQNQRNCSSAGLPPVAFCTVDVVGRFEYGGNYGHASYQSKFQISGSVQPATGRPVPAAQIDETSNWKTYRNDKYGFEIKYPPDWFPPVDVKPPAGYKDPLPDLPVESIIFGNNPDFILATKAISITVMKGFNQNLLPLSQLMKMDPENVVGGNIVATIKPYTKIPGTEAILTEYSPDPAAAIQIDVARGADVYSFLPIIVFTPAVTDRKTFESIVSTFKFIK